MQCIRLLYYLKLITLDIEETLIPKTPQEHLVGFSFLLILSIFLLFYSIILSLSIPGIRVERAAALGGSSFHTLLWSSSVMVADANLPFFQPLFECKPRINKIPIQVWTCPTIPNGLFPTSVL